MFRRPLMVNEELQEKIMIELQKPIKKEKSMLADELKELSSKVSYDEVVNNWAKELLFVAAKNGEYQLEIRKADLPCPDSLRNVQLTKLFKFLKGEKFKVIQDTYYLMINWW